MLYGLYLSAQGADAQSLRQDILANNLANASTTSFKREFAIFEIHPPRQGEGDPDPLPGNAQEQSGGLTPAGRIIDFSNGPIQQTGGDWDLALAGPGFLRVTDGKQEFLTRDGRLDQDRQGNLILREGGMRVLNSAGQSLTVEPDSGPIEVSVEGVVTQRGGQVEIGQLALVEPEDFQALQKIGNNLYEAHSPVRPAQLDTQLKQGFLEGSSTRPVMEMMDLIESTRAFEANINMIRSMDESVGQLLTSLGRK